MNKSAGASGSGRRRAAAAAASLVLGAAAVVGLGGPVDGQVALCGGEVPTIQWGPGATATGGPDVIVGTEGPDVIAGLGGDDIICALGGADMVFGGVGNDVIFGGSGDDDLRGQGGSDTAYGEDGVDQLYGGSGNDTLHVGSGGNLGTPQVVRGQGNNDQVFGGPGNDDLEGGSGLDTIHGGPGDDRLRGGNGADVLWGEAGNDRLEGQSNRDTLYGGPGLDELIGGTGNDDLFGDSGDDFLDGQGGIDECDGGTTGAENGDTATATCEASLNIPFDDATGNVPFCRGIPATIVGTANGETLVGTMGADVIWAGAGNDDVSGLGGDDVICGGPGADQLEGGSGNDVIDGADGEDVVDGNSGDDLLVGGEGDDDISGGDGDDTMLGGQGDDGLWGGDGNDILNGGNNDDTLRGNGGDDYLREGDSCRGGSGQDIIEVCNSTSSGEPANAPQVILFAMLDDADFHDFGYNSTDAITPNIDRVAGEGMTLDNYYSGSGICSPTRLSVMTGENPLAYGLTRLWPVVGEVPSTTQLHLGRKGLDSSVPSLLDLELAGYETAHFGKWHLGDSWAEHGPGPVGFDVYRQAAVTPVDTNGNNTQIAAIPEAQWNANELNWLIGTENGEVLVTDEWRTDYLVDEIIAYIDSLGPGDRAFINWWSLVPHTPIRTPPAFDNTGTNFDLTTERGQLLAMMHEWDEGFGRVLDHLELSGLADESLVMVTSDNGGLRTALSPDRVLSGAKSTLSEGGIRVPFAARWPGEIPAGTQSSHTVVSSDILTTMRSIVGLPERPNYGIDVSPVLRGDTNATRPGGVLWEMKTRSRVIPGAPPEDQDEWAYRDGCYKVIKRAGAAEVELFDVCGDPGESLDLSGDLVNLTAQMTADAEAERRELSRIDVVPTLVDAEQVIPFDERLNIADQDFTLEFLLSADGAAPAGSVDIFESDALEISADSDAGTLTVRILGIESTVASDLDNLVAREIVTPIDTNGSTVRISIQGFLADFSSLTVFVDDAEVGSLTGAESLYSLAAGRSPVNIGANGYVLDNIVAHTIVL